MVAGTAHRGRAAPSALAWRVRAGPGLGALVLRSEQLGLGGCLDATSAIDPPEPIKLKDVHDAKSVSVIDVPAAGGSAAADDHCEARPQEPQASERPVTVRDLPEDVRAKAAASKMPLAMAKALHRFAVAQSPPHDMYIDPDTGLSVFTSQCLKRRPCCGNGCRHCPWGHENVPEQCRKGVAAKTQKLLDW